MDLPLGFGNTSANHQPSRYKHPCTWPGCDRVFTCPHNVQQHIREKHSMERGNKCWKCPATFARPFTLNRHMDQVHGIHIGPGRGKTKRKRGGATAREASYQGAPGAEVGLDIQQAPALPDFDALLTADDAFAAPQDYNAMKNSPFSQTDHFTLCPAAFSDREDLLAHLHNIHNRVHSPDCKCRVCNDRFRMSQPATHAPDQQHSVPFVAGPQYSMPTNSYKQQQPFWDPTFDFTADDVFAKIPQKPYPSDMNVIGNISAQSEPFFTGSFTPGEDSFMDLEGDRWLRENEDVLSWGGEVKMDEADEIMRQL